MNSSLSVLMSSVFVQNIRACDYFYFFPHYFLRYRFWILEQRKRSTMWLRSERIMGSTGMSSFIIRNGCFFLYTKSKICEFSHPWKYVELFWEYCGIKRAAFIFEHHYIIFFMFYPSIQINPASFVINNFLRFLGLISIHYFIHLLVNCCTVYVC